MYKVIHNFIQRHWYRSSFSYLLLFLLPFSSLFFIIITIRRALYRYRILKVHHFSVPIIVVGNIVVGGTGKTPLVIWLANFLQTHGYKPGIVSRGVGGKKHKTPYSVQLDSDPTIVGDEALMLAQHSRCPVVISVNRVAAVKALLASSDCNIVITDDGLQHYRLGRNIEIAVIDGAREFGNGCLLPAGPLREPKKRLQEVDFIVRQGDAVSEGYLMRLRGHELVSICDRTQRVTLEHFRDRTVHAVAGIGHPQRFFATLRAHGIRIVEHSFPDHYRYQASDLQFGDPLPILMTEKDAVKCKLFADERFWYLPVVAELDTEFERALLAKIN